MGAGNVGYLGPRRGPTSKEVLGIDWRYPVYAPPVAEALGEESASKERRSAMPLDEAFAYLAGDDPRPLLVLRECLTCTGTDDALLTRQADNERTMLMSRWFRCVKLPPDVLEADHPFHALFAGDEPAHLFVAFPNGSERADLMGDQSRVELWSRMEDILEEAYAKKHEAAVKKLQRVLDDLDEHDRRLGELDAKLQKEIEKRGPDSRKAEKIRKELAARDEEKAELVADLEEAARLPLDEEVVQERAPNARPPDTRDDGESS